MPSFDRSRLFFPSLGGLYGLLSCISVPLMRICAGLILARHGWPKIQDPFKAVGMVEGLGFYPGTLWSPMLAGTEFIGGLMLAAGLFTRFAAAGATIVLLVTVYLHAYLQGKGVGGAELSILWSTITLYFVAHGGGRYSVDRLLKREI